MLRLISALLACTGAILTYIFGINDISLLFLIIPLYLGYYLASIAMYHIFTYIVSLFINKEKVYETRDNFHMSLFNMELSYLNSTSGAKVKVNGMEKLPNERFLVVYNHKSKFDPMIESEILKKYDMIQISKPSNFKTPLMGNFIRRCCYLSIDRENPRNALATINKAAQFIKEDKFCVGVSPEGTRNYEEGNLLPFKPGCLKIAYKAECPIVVTTIKNADQIHKNFPFKKTEVILDIVDVLNYDDFKDLNTRELAYNIRRMMVEDLGYEESEDESKLCIM